MGVTTQSRRGVVIFQLEAEISEMKGDNATSEYLDPDRLREDRDERIRIERDVIEGEAE